VFEWVSMSDSTQTISLFDTLRSLKKNFYYNRRGQLSTFFQCTIRDFDAFYNRNDELTQLITYDSLGKKKFEWNLDSNQVIPFKDNGLCLYGLVNMKGDTIQSARYENIQTYGEIYNRYFIAHTATQYGALDAFGNAIIAPNWLFLEVFKTHDNVDSLLEQTYLLCCAKTGFGIMQLNGQMVLPPVYQGIRHYKDNLFEVKIGGSWGIVDANGQIIVKPLYPHLNFTEDPNLYLVEELNNVKSYIIDIYGLIRQDGKVLLPTVFKQIKKISDKYFNVQVIRDEAGFDGVFHVEKVGFMILPTI
jgi:WG containing repeat